MKIKIGKIELTDWILDRSSYLGIPEELRSYWYRKLIPYEDFDEVILINIYRVPPYILSQHHSVNFYSQLAFLHQHFQSSATIDGDFAFAKEYVDEFLTRMSKLKSFL